MAKKVFSFDENWAEKIYRCSIGGQDYIAAWTRKKYAENDLETTGPGEYVGITEVEIRKKIRDNDEDSDTYGKRIEDSTAEPKKTLKFTTLFDKNTIKQYRKLSGVTHMGATQLIYIFKQHAYEALDEEEFWSKSMKDVYDSVVRNRPTVNVQVGKQIEED